MLAFATRVYRLYIFMLHQRNILYEKRFLSFSSIIAHVKMCLRSAEEMR